MSESEKLTQRYENEKDPEEKAHIKRELDQMPLTSGQLDQVQQREVDRHDADVRVYREKRSQ